MSMCEMALEIVHYAVLDWRRLVKARAWEYEKFRPAHYYWQVPNCQCNFTELRSFFKSEWCDFILSVNHVATTGERILRQLEGELEEAMTKGAKKERRKA